MLDFFVNFFLIDPTFNVDDWKESDTDDCVDHIDLWTAWRNHWGYLKTCMDSHM